LSAAPGQPAVAPHLVLSGEVAAARARGGPVVALESSIIVQGFPRPDNLALGRALEDAVRAAGATPAILAVVKGRIHIGLEPAELDWLASADGVAKAAARDLGPLVAQGGSGATTVAASLAIARAAGIRVFATGGIGGVHPDHGGPPDISADLAALARTPLVVVSAGAKSILDLPATLEALDSLGVPVVGFGTDVFPAFFAADSGLPVPARLDTATLVARAFRVHCGLGLQAAMLVVNPPPALAALGRDEVANLVAEAGDEARRAGVSGPALTPFLLAALDRLSGGRTRAANRALALANADLAARIAVCLEAREGRT
jgi:pseudouridine-5'-phosphate glycosidase